jgi:hypothetical protein
LSTRCSTVSLLTKSSSSSRVTKLLPISSLKKEFVKCSSTGKKRRFWLSLIISVNWPCSLTLLVQPQLEQLVSVLFGLLAVLPSNRLSRMFQYENTRKTSISWSRVDYSRLNLQTSKWSRSWVLPSRWASQLDKL